MGEFNRLRDRQEGPKPAGAGLVTAYEWLKARQAHQPSLTAELRAMGRQAREEVFSNLIVAFPNGMQTTREMGAPGTPTPGGVDRQLEAEGDAGPARDQAPTAAKDKAPSNAKEPARERDKDREIEM